MIYQSLRELCLKKVDGDITMKGMKEDYYSSKVVPEVPQKDFSNKAVLVMLLIVIVITVVSLVMYLNVLGGVAGSVNNVPSNFVAAEQVQPPHPSAVGIVGLTILPRETTAGGNP